jgi:putative flippase GtrA
MTAVIGLYRRWAMLVHELTKFGIVGVFNTGLDFGIANLLHVGLHTNQYLAKTISVTIAATSSYFMNRYWTFRHRARTGLGREYALFFLLNGVGLVIALACIWLVMGPLDRHGALWFNVAQVLGLVLGMLFRFTTYKRWVFLAPATSPESEPPAEVAESEDGQPAWSRIRA